MTTVMARQSKQDIRSNGLIWCDSESTGNQLANRHYLLSGVLGSNFEAQNVLEIILSTAGFEQATPLVGHLPRRLCTLKAYLLKHL